MEYIPPFDGTGSDPYDDGNPAGGIEGSIPPAEFFNDIQAELLAVIAQGGLTPDGATLTQVRDAIAAMIAAGAGAAPYDVPFSAGYTAIMTDMNLGVQTYGEMVVGRAFTATGEAGYLGTVATDADCIVDVEKNGTTIYTTKPEFAASANALTPGVLKDDGTEIFAAGDRLTFKVTQVGSTIAGARLRFTLRGTVN